MQALSIIVDGKSYPVLNLPGRPKALLDITLAEIFGSETKRINEAANRNPEKFPEDFYFTLTLEETKALNEVAICDLDWKGGHLHKAYTHLGSNMMSTVRPQG